MIATLIASTVLALLLILAAFFLRQQGKSISLIAKACVLFAIAPLVLSAYILYYTLLKPYSDAYVNLQPGVTYQRESLETSGKRAVVHVVTIDLNHAYIDITLPVNIAGKLQHQAMTTTAALEQSRADIAINASFFAPFKERYLFDYYPHTHDMVEPIGPTVADGQLYGVSHVQWPGFVVSNDGQLSIGSYQQNQRMLNSGQVRHLISGLSLLVDDGKVVVEQPDKNYPRSVIALNAARNTLWLVVVDGKQPAYSEGMALRWLADYLIKLGVDTALELDGGGSATLAWRHRDNAILLNRPSHTKIPNRQRPVANHILVRAIKDE